MRDPGVRVGKVLEEGSSGQAGRWVLRERGVERGYGSARARTEQSRERGEDPGRRKGKDLTRGPGLSVGDATSAAERAERALLGCGEFDAGRNGPDAGVGPRGGKVLGCYVPRAGLRKGGRGWARGKRALVYWAGWARVEFGVGFG